MMVPRKVLLAVTASAILLASGKAALAQVVVDGRPEMVHVEARDVPLSEVLAALRDKFNLHYRSDDVLQTRKTGVFAGPLQRVAVRILDGYDFAMKITPHGIDVLVLRQNQSGEPAFTAATAVAIRPPMTAAEIKHFANGHFR